MVCFVACWRLVFLELDAFGSPQLEASGGFGRGNYAAPMGKVRPNGKFARLEDEDESNQDYSCVLIQKQACHFRLAK